MSPVRGAHLTRGPESARVGCDVRTLEGHLQQAVEGELKRLVFFFTHRVSPFVVGFPASEPREIRARRMIRWVGYHDEIGNPGLKGTAS